MHCIIIKEDDEIQLIKDYSKEYPFPVKLFYTVDEAKVYAKREGHEKYSILRRALLLKIIN